MIVQPINLLFDRVSRKIFEKISGKFVLCALANPSGDANGEKELEKLLYPTGAFKAVRFNPGLWPENEKMTIDISVKQCFVYAAKKTRWLVSYFMGLTNRTRKYAS